MIFIGTAKGTALAIKSYAQLCVDIESKKISTGDILERVQELQRFVPDCVIKALGLDKYENYISAHLMSKI